MNSVFLKLRYEPGRIETRGTGNYLREHPVNRSDGLRDGVWSEWNWNGTELRAANCRYGLEPLYYFHSGNEFCIANSLMALLAQGAPRELNDDGLAVFVRRHNFLGGDTPFRHIHRLLPNSRLHWQENRLSITTEPFRSSPLHLKPDAVIDGLHELFEQAIRRRLPETENFTVPLSGGKESRRILFELARQMHPPRFCVTSRHMPPRADEDLKVATLIAERMGIELRVIPVERANVRLQEITNEKTDLSTFEHAWLTPMTNYLGGTVETSYDGITTDCSQCGEQRARLFNEGNLTELAGDLLGDSEAMLSRILNRDVYRRLSREKAVRRMVDELRLHADQVCPLSSFLFWSRIHRGIGPSPFSMMSGVRTVHTPFLDKEFFEFILSVPEPILVGGTTYKKAIARSYPDHSDIPFADAGLDTNPNRHQNRLYLAELLIRLATKNPSSRLINVPWTLMNLGKSAITGSQERLNWMQPDLICYLIQLERIAGE